MDSENSKPAPENIQIRKASRAIHITVGTKIPAILSANFAMGALEALASSTRRMIWLIVVFSPVFTAFI